MKKLLRAIICTSLLRTLVLPALAQTTAFTYQGRLNDGVNPANGKYDLTFALFSVVSGAGQVGSILTNAATGAKERGVVAALIGLGRARG